MNDVVLDRQLRLRKRSSASVSKLAFSSWMGPCGSPPSLSALLRAAVTLLSAYFIARWVHNPRAKEMAGAIKKELGQLKSVMSAFAFPGLPRPDICQFSIWCFMSCHSGDASSKVLTGNRAAQWVAVYFVVLPSDLW